MLFLIIYLFCFSEITSKRTESGFEVTFKIEIPWNVLSAEMTEATLWLYSKKETNLNRCKFYSKTCGSSNDDFTFITTDSSDFKGNYRFVCFIYLNVLKSFAAKILHITRA